MFCKSQQYDPVDDVLHLGGTDKVKRDANNVSKWKHNQAKKNITQQFDRLILSYFDGNHKITSQGKLWKTLG